MAASNFPAPKPGPERPVSMTVAMTAPHASDPDRARADSRWLRGGLAFIWLATGLGVLHPYYRLKGTVYLEPLGLPPEVMVATCVGEVLLGLSVAWGRAGTVLTALQLGMIVTFTAILSVTQPALWTDPNGMLTKNLPLLGFLAAAWLLDREGRGARAGLVLRGGLALFWLADGLLPHLLFPLPAERAGVLRVVGVLEIALGLGLVGLRGRALRGVLLLQALTLVGLAVCATRDDPLAWFHPFGPLTKDVPLLVGTRVVFRQDAQRKNVPTPGAVP